MLGNTQYIMNTFPDLVITPDGSPSLAALGAKVNNALAAPACEETASLRHILKHPSAVWCPERSCFTGRPHASIVQALKKVLDVIDRRPTEVPRGIEFNQLDDPPVLVDDDGGFDGFSRGAPRSALAQRVCVALLRGADKGNLEHLLRIRSANWCPTKMDFKEKPCDSVVRSLEVLLQAQSGEGPSCSELNLCAPRKVHLTATVGYNPMQMHNIFKHLLEREKQDRPIEDAMSRHEKLEPHYRMMLVDWLIEVFMCWKLRYQTIYKAVVLFDRILSTATCEINKSDVQLIGVTALFIACKKEEVCKAALSFSLSRNILKNGHTVNESAIRGFGEFHFIHLAAGYFVLSSGWMASYVGQLELPALIISLYFPSI